MAASTAAREASRKLGDIQLYQMGIVKINKGTLVSVRTDGYLYPARSGTATDVFVGVAYEGFDNSTGTAGANSIRVYKEGSYIFAAASATSQTNVGTAFYANDDQTVTATATSNQLVGYCTEVIDASDLRIRINRAVQ